MPLLKTLETCLDDSQRIIERKPFRNAKMRCFRSRDFSVWPEYKEGPLVWILEHDLLPEHPLGKDWRNYDPAKLADDFRELVRNASYGPPLGINRFPL